MRFGMLAFLILTCLRATGPPGVAERAALGRDLNRGMPQPSLVTGSVPVRREARAEMVWATVGEKGR